MSATAADVFSPRGVYSPTITAFEKDESVSLTGTRAFVRFLLSQGVDGLVHVSPEAAAGGPLGLVHTGDMITLDVPGRRIHLELDDATLSQRHAQWTPPPAPQRGWAKLYFDHVLQAHEGADLDFLVGCSGAPIPRDSH